MITTIAAPMRCLMAHSLHRPYPRGSTVVQECSQTLCRSGRGARERHLFPRKRSTWRGARILLENGGDAGVDGGFEPGMIHLDRRIQPDAKERRTIGWVAQINDERTDGELGRLARCGL